jgi:hypothetical protein
MESYRHDLDYTRRHFIVVVDCGKEMLAIETDADTVVSGTFSVSPIDPGDWRDFAIQNTHAADAWAAFSSPRGGNSVPLRFSAWG